MLIKNYIMYKFFSIILSDSCQAVSSPYWDLNELLKLNELFLYKIILFSGYFLFGIGTWSSFWNCLLWLLWQIFQKKKFLYFTKNDLQWSQIKTTKNEIVQYWTKSKSISKIIFERSSVVLVTEHSKTCQHANIQNK